MTTGNEPAMPTGQNQSGTGLTKREYFAIRVLQGLIANCYLQSDVTPDYRHAEKAVDLADYLIDELNKP